MCIVLVRLPLPLHRVRNEYISFYCDHHFSIFDLNISTIGYCFLFFILLCCLLVFAYNLQNTAIFSSQSILCPPPLSVSPSLLPSFPRPVRTHRYAYQLYANCYCIHELHASSQFTHHRLFLCETQQLPLNAHHARSFSEAFIDPFLCLFY